MRFLLLLALFGSTVALPTPLLSAQTAPPEGHHEHAPARPSSTLRVRFGDQTVVLSLADVQALPQTSATVMNAHTKSEETYTGPTVANVLAKAGFALSGATEHAVLRSYVVATGTDGYFVVFSGAELQTALHKGQFLVAITEGGQPLAANGAFQLIDSLDAKPARWVRNMDGLSVVPIPAAPAR